MPQQTMLKKKVLTFKCSLCTRQFNNNKNLLFHKRRVHSLPLSIRRKNLYKCPLCNENFSKKNFTLHLQMEHEIPMEKEEREFSTFEDFMLWKESFERETKSKFVKFTKEHDQLHVKYIYFGCHRSGHYISKAQGMRHLKIQGSNKINSYCPASIKVSQFNNGKCTAYIRKTHVGHKNDIGHLPLSKSERQLLATKIAGKVPFDAILDEIRDSLSDTGLERLHLLTKKDLWNIENSYNLQSNAVRHKNDCVSVEAWVNEMASEDNNCILFYKPQNKILENYPEFKNDDFALIIMNDSQRHLLQKFGADCICIDGTHGLNSYGFELITLLVLDDLRQGFPCA
ncbi:uncharacterized protein LOC118184730 [Stegodyphus dumicola]|uniref:uncharacterized protein LOC118184730 n=1 Tax=Stegodyphus dumicola TaxID=202533 RepID=UPI0015A95808|nr:uncharacterized protein LOC118184730 [Stegodyphus dumicola]